MPTIIMVVGLTISEHGRLNAPVLRLLKVLRCRKMLLPWQMLLPSLHLLTHRPRVVRVWTLFLSNLLDIKMMNGRINCLIPTIHHLMASYRLSTENHCAGLTSFLFDESIFVSR